MISHSNYSYNLVKINSMRLGSEPFIEIQSLGDLISQGWAGNGSRNNPYVISGLNIISNETIIAISNIQVFVLVSNCSFTTSKTDTIFDDSIGIIISNCSNLIIKNCIFQNFLQCIAIHDSTNCNVTDSMLFTKSGSAVFINKSSSCTISKNVCDVYDGRGIEILDSLECLVLKNTITNDGLVSTFWNVGLSLHESEACVVRSNTLIGPGVGIQGSNLLKWMHNFSSNIVNNKPLGFFLLDSKKEISASKYGQIFLVNCTKMVVQSGTVNSTSVGISFAFSQSCLIENVNITKAKKDAIFIQSSKNITLYSSNLADCHYGIRIEGSTNCKIVESNIVSSSYAVSVDDCSKISIMDVNSDSCFDGISVIRSSECIIDNCMVTLNYVGIYLDRSTNCVISNNSISESTYCGIQLSRSNSCNVLYNMIRYSDWRSGILLDDECTLNYIISNTLFRNEHGNAEDYGYENIWNGNTWGDYIGIGVYLIPGSANSIDFAPIMFSDTLNLLVTSITIIFLSTALALYALRKRRETISVYFVTAPSLIIQYLVPPIKGLENTLPVTTISTLYFDVLLMGIASWSIVLSEKVTVEKNIVVDGAFCLSAIMVFILLTMHLLNIYYIGLIAPVVSLFMLGFIHSKSDTTFADTILKFHKSIHEKVEFSYFSVITNSFEIDRERYPVFFYITAYFSFLLIPILGIFIGLFGYTLSQGGVLALLILGVGLIRDIINYQRKNDEDDLELPIDEEVFLRDLKHGGILSNAVLLPGILIAFASINAIVVTLTAPWAPPVPAVLLIMWLVNIIISLFLSFHQIHQSKNVTEYDTYKHRGPPIIFISFLFVNLLTLFALEIRKFPTILGRIFGLQVEIIIIWIVLCIYTLVRSVRQTETSDIRFIVRTWVVLCFNMAFGYWTLIFFGLLEGIIGLALFQFAVLFMLVAIKQNYPINTLLYLTAIILVSIALLNTSLVQIGYEIFILFLFFSWILIIYSQSWRRIRPIVTSHKPTMDALRILIQKSISLTNLAILMNISEEETFRILKSLKSIGIIDVRGREYNIQYQISSSYYRKRIRDALK